MTFWEAVVLGVVQGATEFLPVSSSGHLVLSQELLGLELPGVVFEVAVHVATLVSILMVYRTRVAGLAVGTLAGERDAWRYVGMLVVATIPAAVLGLAFQDRVEALFEAPEAVGVAFLVTGLALFSSRWALRRSPDRPPGWVVAVGMGLAQALALAPGISRSGSTVVAALWMGVAPAEAAAFSFLMAVPAIAGAAVLQIPEVAGRPLVPGAPALLAGGVAAAVTGVLAIRTFVALLRRRSFHQFAYYLWGLGAAFLAWLALA